MSAKYTFLAWETPVDNAGTKLALLQLANNADDNGFSYYSISKMAESCDMSERSFMRKIQELESLGVLTVERRANRSSLYQLVGDEMGVTICHEQQLEVTVCHAGVTICHARGDNLSHDPNSTLNTSLKNTLSSSAKTTPVPYERIKDAYNENIKSFAKVQVLSAKRKPAMKKFFSMMDKDLEKVAAYFEYFESKATAHHRGENERGWKASFDFIIREDVVTRAIEGSL